MRVRGGFWLALVGWALVSCGGKPEGGEPTGGTKESSPPATFEAMKRATLDGDWEALYALNAPSERKAAEAKWDAARTAAGGDRSFVTLGERAGVGPTAAAEMTLGESFAARNAHQAEAGGKPRADAIATMEYVGTEDEQEGGDVLMVRFRVTGNEQTIPMRREDGRWYVSRLLAALTDF